MFETSSHYSIVLSTISDLETNFFANTLKYRNSNFSIKLLCDISCFPVFFPFIYDNIYRSSFVRICNYTRASQIFCEYCKHVATFTYIPLHIDALMLIGNSCNCWYLICTNGPERTQHSPSKN